MMIPPVAWSVRAQGRARRKLLRGRGGGRALGSGEAESIFRGRGGGRALGPGEAETSPEAEAQGRARRSFLWRLRLDSAAVSLTLVGGIAVGEGRAALFSCQVS
jgi:hypothetical protein